MSDLRLNLTALRRRHLFESQPEIVRAEDLAVTSGDGFQFSRRQVLRSAGIAAVAIAPGLRAARAHLAPHLRGPFRLEQDEYRVTFLLGKSKCWTIDTRRFAGSPKLVVDRSENLLRVEMKNACYPGTTLPADFIAEIRPHLTECTLDLKLSLGGFHGKVPLETWLAGDARLTSEVSLSHEVRASEGMAILCIGGNARAEFYPEWKLALSGIGLVALAGFGEPLLSNELSIAMPPSTVRSSVRSMNAKRTLLSLDRGSRSWNLDHGIHSESDWTLDIGENAFDRITMEALDRGEGLTAHSIIAEQVGATTSAEFKPLAVKGMSGNAVGLPLVRARYASLYEAGSVERAFEAHYREEPVWLHGNTTSFLVGAPRSKANDGAQAQDALPTFEIYARDGMLHHIHCEPALLKISVPMKDAIVEPADVPDGTRLVFSHGPQEPHPYRVSFPLNDGGDTNPFRFPANFVIAAIRPDDLVALKFEFINMEFKGGKDSMKLVKAKLNKDIYGSYLVVHFPPQNIAEQAFFETSAENFKPPTPGEPLTPPPVKSRLAGPSRLAFYIPDDVDSLPYSLEGLLDWSKLQPSVVPVALPPPAPPILVYLNPLGIYRQSRLAEGNLGSKLQVNGSKLNRASVNLKSFKTAQTYHPIVTDVRTSPKFVVTTDESSKQRAISSIRQNTKSTIPDEQLSQVGSVIGQLSSAFPAYDKLLPGLILDMHIREPKLFETSLETPWRLILSPNYYSGWAHSTKPVAATDAKSVRWVELWHTRLGIKRTDKNKNITIDEEDDYYRTLRAIWSPDYNPNDGPGGALSPNHFNPNSPSGSNIFRMSLDARDRHELVELTSDFLNFKNTDQRIVRAERFMLSSMGAWMNTRGAWEVPFNASKPLSLEEWRHRSTMGRDHYVRVVYKGFLFPFGHPASLIKVTERKFIKTGNFMTAYLRQRMFIVVRQPVKQFPAEFQQNDARKLPFKSVEITTLITPDLDPPSAPNAIYPSDPQTAFWPSVGGNPFLFHAIGSDWEGHKIEFTTPLGFIDNTRAYDHSAGSAIDKAISSYMAKTDKSKLMMNGQKIAYSESKKSGDTTFETTSITFGAEGPLAGTTTNELGLADQPAFYPTLEQSELHIEAVKQITGMVGSTPFKYNQTFVEHAWDAVKNAGHLFMELEDLSNPIGLAFGGSGAKTDTVGGIATPSMGITGLSRLSGPVSGDLSSILGGQFDPAKFFQGLDPSSIQLFGGITLMDILKLVGGLDSSLSSLKDDMESKLKDYGKDLVSKLTADALESLDLPKSPIPSYVTQAIYDAGQAAQQGAQDVENALKIPKQIQILFKWDPEVQSAGPFNVDGDPKDTLSLTALILIPINAPDLSALGTPPDPSKLTPPSLGSPSITVLAKLKKFTMDLFGVIAIKFNSVTFKVENGKKPDVNADVEDVAFEGPLEFVNDLEKIIPSDGFTDPPSLEITPTGVKIGYDLGLPTISVGAFALENISLGAELSLPFTGDPVRFRFHFCTREDPFHLTIYCFGGGGFFGIELGLDGVELLEASFEFGASVSLDVGVASGGVSIMAGIYFKLQKKSTGDESQLTGYLRINGNLNVCGIISISIELYMEISYDSGPPKKAWGQATLSFSVSVLFFSISFSTTMEKDFVDPALTFAQLMDGEQWSSYRLAFMDEFITY